MNRFACVLLAVAIVAGGCGGGGTSITPDAAGAVDAQPAGDAAPGDAAPGDAAPGDAAAADATTTTPDAPLATPDATPAPIDAGAPDADPASIDDDGDGWTESDGDCCDTTADCPTPALVNPGAFELLGTGVDDDCDPTTVDGVAAPDCGPPALLPPATGLDLVHAMELCATTTETPPLAMKTWGVISAELLLADGVTPLSAVDNVQTGVLSDYGPNVLPRKGATMAALSSGTARDPGDPGYVHPQNGTMPGQIGNFNAATTVGAPAAYLAAHGGVLPSTATCPACVGATCGNANDSVLLKVRLRVPTNANGFSYQLKFYTAEFPEFVCSSPSDYFLTLLDGAVAPPMLPADKNVCFDGTGDPITVNGALITECFPPVGSPPGACPGGTLGLVGTGMGGWGTNLTDGGATEWLTNDVPVVPGEVIELSFVIFDGGDHNVDSVVLLDKFRWLVTAPALGTHP